MMAQGIVFIGRKHSLSQCCNHDNANQLLSTSPAPPCLQAKRTAEKQVDDAEAKNAELSSTLDAMRSELQAALDKEATDDKRTNEFEGWLEKNKARSDDLQQELSMALAAKEEAPQVRPALPLMILAKHSNIKFAS